MSCLLLAAIERYHEKENIQERNALFTRRDKRERENPNIPELLKFKNATNSHFQKNATNSHFQPPQPLNYCQIRRELRRKTSLRQKCHIFC